MKKTFDELLQLLPVDCRKATRRALLMTAKSDTIDSATVSAALEELIKSVHRTNQRRESDKRTDFYRRRLVGARVPSQDYLRFLFASERKGLSLYRWVYDALTDAADRQEQEEKQAE